MATEWHDMPDHWRLEQGGTAGESIASQLLTQLDCQPTELGLGFLPYAGQDRYPADCLLSLVLRSRRALKHMPDLVAGRSDLGGAFFVEVFASTGDYANFVLAQSKLDALDLFAQLAPVVILDATTQTAWVHGPGWRQRATPGPPSVNGSGTAYVLFPRDAARDASELLARR